MLGGLAGLAATLYFNLGPLFGLGLLLFGCAVPMLAMEQQGEPSTELNRLHLWVLKLFFVPFYTVGLFYNLTYCIVGKGLLTLVLGIYSVDVALMLVGYLFASPRTFYSVQPLGFGWVVCLICYGPFIRHWPEAQELVSNELFWPHDLRHVALAIPMLSLLALTFSSSVVFGLRGANLGYRGVITNGPFRLMKHPAYFCHAAYAWITALFFLPLTLSTCAVAAVVTVIYRLRAITEERHLRRYPEYVAYCDWIARHGLVARVSQVVVRLLPVPASALRFRKMKPSRIPAASSPTSSGLPR